MMTITVFQNQSKERTICSHSSNPDLIRKIPFWNDGKSEVAVVHGTHAWSDTWQVNTVGMHVCRMDQFKPERWRLS